MSAIICTQESVPTGGPHIGEILDAAVHIHEEQIFEWESMLFAKAKGFKNRVKDA